MYQKSMSHCTSGVFTFSRSGGSTSVALNVSFTVSGTATQFSDYSGLGSQVTIPAGSTSITAQVTPYDDLIIEGDETAIVTIATNSLYTIGASSSATVTIVDNDTTKPTVTVTASDAN